VRNQAEAGFRIEKWGPALLPAPTAPSEGSAGIRNLVDRSFRPIDPLSILAHQLRRRFPSCSSLVRGARLLYLTAPPEGSLVFRPARPAETSIRRPNFPRKPPDVPRPFLGQSLPRPASLTVLVPSEEAGAREPRRATENCHIRRLIPADPNWNPKVLFIACRRRSDLWSPAAPFLPFPALRGGRDRRPDHEFTMHI
jgi:hypothetical protein